MAYIPAPSPPKHSRPIPEGYLKDYFPTLEARVSCRADDELREASGMYEDWLRRGGYECTVPWVPNLGGIIALAMPETDPEKMAEVGAASSFGFLEDSFYDGDAFSFPELADKTEPEARDLLAKNYQNLINQLKSKIFCEMLEKDSNQNRYVQAYEEWVKACTERAGNLDGVEFDTLEESENEWVAQVAMGKPGLPTSSLYIIMRLHDVSLGEAKEILKRKWLDIESSFLQVRERLIAECGPHLALEYARYLSCLQYAAAGLVIFSKEGPRYALHKDPGNNPLCPRQGHKIKDLPRKTQSSSKNGANASPRTNGAPTTGADSLTNGHAVENDHGHSELQNIEGELTAKLKTASGMPETRAEKGALVIEILQAFRREPYDYIKSMPSKGIRNVAIDALDIWYMVPQRSLEIVKNIIGMLHTSSLIIDDIEDCSELRRGQPSAHMVFGIPQSINTANYLFVKCLFEAQKLSPSAVAIFEDELRNLHIGQGPDLHWTFHQECPSEVEYIQMIDGKTGGLFRMASRLMRDQATQNKDLEVEDLLTLIGRFFQIRDDHQNLRSVDYTRAKGSLSDLDEGKYSFMLIHALKNQKYNHQLKSLLQLRSQKGFLTEEQKDLIMKIMERSNSMEYTAMVLKEISMEVEVKLGYIEAQLAERGFKEDKNWMIRAIMARLKLPDPITGSLMK
ncbi:hypothetical protein TWF225_011709 [Orbilia oligospora]|nr:hypothetical protein TWF225_011709 [Orbilia oligospora]KAF3244671.1 hypothetical protein TWF217_010715 [Orbilia oligospora]